MTVGAADQVYEHLKRLDSLRAVRELFSDLNYEVAAPIPVSRREWPQDARGALAEDPQVIAQHGPFRVIYGGSTRIGCR